MFDIRDKSKNVNQMNTLMFNKTLSMFNWRGLPETTPKKELELMLQKKGHCFFTVVDGVPRILSGSLGGELDEFENPTQYIVNIPHLRINDIYDVNEDGVLIQNDFLGMGLIPLIEKYNTLLAENELNMEMLGFNTRILTFLSAGDDKTKQSAETFIKKVKDGERSVIGDNAMFDGIKSHSGGQGNNMPITEMIEYHQYLKSTLLSELGINAPFNMKRERVNSGEVKQHEDQLNVFIDNMKESRDNAISKINNLYGYKIKCEFSKAWSREDETKAQKPIA